MSELKNQNRPAERRSGAERRSSRTLLPGTKDRRRHQLRRAEDRRKIFLLDHYPKPLLASAALILLLSLGDAVLTLILVGHGAVELNPVMDHFLKAGPVYFWLVKYALTAFAVTIVLLLHYCPLRGLNIPVHSFLGVFTLLFSAAIVWQVYLITRYVL